MTKQPIPTSAPSTDSAPAEQLSLVTQLGSMLSAQNWHWRRGSAISIEELSKENVEALSKEQQLSLICNEVYLREVAGQTPTLAEYQNKYPHLAAELAIQWELDHFLSPVLPADETPRASPLGTWGAWPTKWAEETGQRFTTQSKIGCGGMGEVYLAVDNRLKRIVALKRLTDRAAQHGGARARFAREAELIAQLNDPHVVPIFDTGEETGIPYIAMEYCPGGSLHDWLRQGPLKAKTAAEVVRQIALGIEAAHRISVVHRDLKPGNILLMAPADAAKKIHIKVSDFGLARRIDDLENFTQTGEILGTPSYMAPEQIDGGEPAQAPSVDIYALGAILYECLTGRPPFHGSSPFDTLRLLASQEIVPIERLQPGVPIDLAAICHKCLQRKPQDRYESAQAVSEDLQRFLDGKPTVASPAPWPAKLWKWARRHPSLTAGIGLATLAALVMLGVWISFTRQLQIERNKAQAESKIAKLQSQRAQRNAEWSMTAVDTLITQVGDKKLDQIPGMAETRKVLLQAAVDFCKKFFEDRDSEDPDALNDVGQAHRRLAKIYRSLGENEEWIGQLRSASAIHRQLVARYPNQPKYLLELGKTLNNLSNAEGEILGPDVAAVTSEEAIQLKEKLVELDPTSVEYRSSLAVSLYSIGPKLRLSNPLKAEKYFKRSVALLASLIADQPGKFELRRSLAGVRANWSALANGQGRFAEATQQAEKRVETLRELNQIEPGIKTSYDLLEGMSALAATYASELKIQQATEIASESTTGLKQFAQQFPENVEFVASYLESAYNLGSLQRDLQQHDKSLATLGEAIGSVEVGSKVALSNAVERARLERALALTHLEMGQFAESIAAIERSEKLLAEFALHRPGSIDQLEGKLLLATNFLCQGQSTQAKEILANDWPVMHQRISTSDGLYYPTRIMLRWAANLMLIHLRTGEFEQAESVLSDVVACQPKQAETHLALLKAMMQSQHGQYTAALDAVEKYGQLRDVSDFWPDHLPTFIVNSCLKKAQSDPALKETERLAIAERCQQLLPNYKALADHRLGYTLQKAMAKPYSRRALAAVRAADNSVHIAHRSPMQRLIIHSFCISLPLLSSAFQIGWFGTQQILKRRGKEETEKDRESAPHMSHRSAMRVLTRRSESVAPQTAASAMRLEGR